ncbi:M43 family zinc metalloprotease [Saprospira grandis]|uniref:Metalloprotease Fpp2 n=1 Tax=Saprospira grandis (strain Lewin) TaxID=984262 RepID=H6L0T1_SAPGL|nr:M43 family zinc metalloprotease [Saprospira grandis]AFC25887.1 metalloprotease Fpp2 precursor [Saprospira grandis str. Lewin]
MRLLYTLLLFTGLTTGLLAQKPANAPRAAQNQTSFQRTPSGHIRCATVEMEAERMRKQLKTNYVEDFERWIAPKVAEYKQKAARSGAKSVVYRIPVVVHVLHNGDPVGTDENISDAQILSQIQVMNEDFRKLAGTPGDGSGVDVEIEFCMAQYDETNGPSTGINRVNIGQTGVTRNQLENTIKPNTQWDPTQYLNMWTCRFVAPDNGLLGYAQFPSASGLGGMPANGGAANTDGVVMLFSAFGSSAIAPGGTYNAPYDLGRTTTHEVGHWLGLRHIWGDGDCTLDDFCADTPESDDPNYGCATGHVSCGTTDLVENYMDYSNDACMNNFTADQKARMVVVMNNSPRRMELASSTKCAPPTPTIAFDLDQTAVTEGTDCNFQEFTLDLNIALPPSDDAVITFVPSGTATQGEDYDFFPSSVTFLAGQQNTQTLTVRIYNDGIIEATEDFTIGMNLSTVGDAAITTTDNRQHVFTVQDDDYAPIANQLVDVINVDFESGAGGFTTSGNTANNMFSLGTAATASSQYWTIDNSNATTFAYTNDDGCNACDKSADYLFSPVFSLQNANSTTFSFDHAFADEAPETGIVSISTNGAAGPFVPLLTLSNTSTNGGNGLRITPWVTVNSNLDAYLGQNNLMLRFEYSDGGDWMYGMALDNILLQATFNTDIQEAVNTANNDDLPLGPNNMVYFYDPATSNVMGSIENTSAWDYGCTTLEVDRSTASNAGPTAPFIDLLAANALMAKTFYLDPSSNNASGTYNATFYFTETEIAAWEAATGKTRADLKIVKVANNPISDVTPGNYASYNIEYVPATIASFGANGVTLSANFSTGFSGFGFGDPSPTLLSNNLLSFEAKRAGDQALLSWETTAEEGCNSFSLQHSANGIDFEDLFQITAEGQAASYQKVHARPLNGYNYYRLLQHFDNGSTYYSSVRVLDMRRNTLEAIRLQPNPAREQINLLFYSNYNSEIQIEIVDALGRQITPPTRVSVSEGENQFQFPLQDLAAGIYFLRIQQGGQNYHRRFVKQ